MASFRCSCSGRGGVCTKISRHHHDTLSRNQADWKDVESISDLSTIKAANSVPESAAIKNRAHEDAVREILSPILAVYGEVQNEHYQSVDQMVRITINARLPTEATTFWLRVLYQTHGAVEPADLAGHVVRAHQLSPRPTGENVSGLTPSSPTHSETCWVGWLRRFTPFRWILGRNAVDAFGDATGENGDLLPPVADAGAPAENPNGPTLQFPIRRSNNNQNLRGFVSDEASYGQLGGEGTASVGYQFSRSTADSPNRQDG